LTAVPPPDHSVRVDHSHHERLGGVAAEQLDAGQVVDRKRGAVLVGDRVPRHDLSTVLAAELLERLQRHRVERRAVGVDDGAAAVADRDCLGEDLQQRGEGRCLPLREAVDQ
jgi:hypothetical protein